MTIDEIEDRLNILKDYIGKDIFYVTWRRRSLIHSAYIEFGATVRRLLGIRGDTSHICFPYVCVVGEPAVDPVTKGEVLNPVYRSYEHIFLTLEDVRSLSSVHYAEFLDKLENGREEGEP